MNYYTRSDISKQCFRSYRQQQENDDLAILVPHGETTDANNLTSEVR